MVLITAFPMTAYAAESPNTIKSTIIQANGDRFERSEELSKTLFPVTEKLHYKGTIKIVYTTSESPVSYVEVDGERITSYTAIPIRYQVIPGLYRFEQHITFDVAGIVGANTKSSLITFATGNSLYGIHVNWD